jgi:DNA-binding LacI/PurR family transcriptional regulator
VLVKLAAERQAAILRAIELRGGVTVTEIATRLGVSTVTVRRDIGTLADQGLVDRVHGGAVARNGSAPSPGRSDHARQAPRATVGLVLPSATYYFPGVIRGAEAAAAAAGVRLVLAVTNYFPEEDRRQVGRLLDLGVEGLLVATSRAPDTDPEVSEWVAGLPVPVVLVERMLDLPGAAHVGHVRTDHAAGARLAVLHLAGLGHSTVAVAARGATPTTRWLLDGHAAAVTQGVIDGRSPEATLLPGPEAGPALRDAALHDLLDKCAERGTRAILVHNDEDAMAVVRAATARRMQVPADLSVVAYDDEVAALADVPLTAVAPPKHEVGRLAVDVLVQRLAGPSDQPAQHVSLLPRLVNRSSCAAFND